VISARGSDTLGILKLNASTLLCHVQRVFRYTFFLQEFSSPNTQAGLFFLFYLLGIILAIIVAKVFKGIFFKHEVAPLIMELPPYRLPILRWYFFIHGGEAVSS